MTSEHDSLRDELLKQIKSLPAVRSPANKDPDFDTSLRIPVMAAKKGDIENRLQVELAKIGIAVIVRKGNFSKTPLYKRFPFEVEILEQSTLNRRNLGSNVTAHFIGDRISHMLEGWCPFDVYSSAREINIAETEESNKISVSIQFNFQAVYVER